MRRGLLIGLAVLVVISLAIGLYWTKRLDVPTNPRPWWQGKDVVVRVEVWEGGKDMPTFAMTMPKKTLDAMYVMGMRQVFNADGHRIELNEVWRDLQRLPKGQKLTFHERDATVTIWIEEKGARSVTQPDTTGAS